MEVTAIDVSLWEKAGIIAGIVTSVLFLVVLGVQIAATLATRKAADAATEAAKSARESAGEAKQSNELATLEMRDRLRPSLGMNGLNMRCLDSEVGAPEHDSAVDEIEISFKNFGLLYCDRTEFWLQKTYVSQGKEAAQPWEEIPQAVMFPTEVSTIDSRLTHPDGRPEAYQINLQAIITYSLREQQWTTKFSGEIEVRADESKPHISWRNTEAT